MRIVRSLGLAAFVLACTGVVGLVCADRLAHPAATPIVAQTVAPEPSATGSIAVAPKPVAAAKPTVPSIPNGFDTERLNALMRGDPILPSRR